MADNLLDKASILLTPTAYRDGGMLSVKPNENLYGSELVTNGNFATDSDWTAVNSGGWTISGGSANCDGTSSASAIYQQNILVVGKTYKITFTAIITSGTVAVSAGFSGTGTSRTVSGTYTEILTAATNDELYIKGTSNFTGSIDNISVVEDLSGDFTFSRSSAATRVNAQGLVENVQIISSELVSNGNFSQIGTEEVSNGNFSQEGSELITNGDFANWTNDNPDNYLVLNENANNYVTESNGQLRMVSDNSATIAIRPEPTNMLTTGKIYKVSVDLTFTSGTIDISGTSFNTSGTKVFYLTAPASYLQISKASALDVLIDNVSVKEVGQNWSLESGWSIGDGSLVANSVTTGLAFQSNIVEANKSYKATYSVVVTSGSVGLYFDGGTGYQGVVTTTQTITVFFKATTTSPLYFRSNTSNFTGSITNISVKEVGQDWTLGTGWSMGDDKAVFDTTSNASLLTNLSISSGNLYRLKIEGEVTSGNLKLSGSSGLGNNEVISLPFEQDILHDGGGNTVEIRTIGSAEGFVTNVSVKEITDDTDLPRINYEGFSYQDSLGSEEVVNGDFSNGSANWGNYTSGSSTIVFTDVATLNVDASNSNVGIYQENVFASGKQYKVVLRIKASSSFDAEVLETQGAVTISTIGSVSLTTSYQDFTFYFTGTGTNDIFIHRKFSSPSANQSITIDNVSVKEYLGQEVVPDSGCGSWLLEGQSTNLITYSSDLSSLNSRSNAVVTSNEVISPSGDLDADKITFDGTLYGRVEQTIPATIGQPYTISVYLKNKDLSDVTQVWIGFSQVGQGQFVTITDEWQRYDITTNADGTSEYPRIQFSGTGSLYAWGFQTEQQSYATSYIPTNGATNTRLQDIANNSGNSTLINSTEGVLYAEMAALANDGNFRMISISDGTNDNRVRINYTATSNQIGARVVDGGVTQADFTHSLTDSTDFVKLAIYYKNNDCAFWINGTKIGTDTSATIPSGLDTLNLNGGGGSPFYGKNKALAVYKEALTDANLRSLTYPNPVATTFDLDFDTIAEQFTFTRGSEATFVNAQGLIESTASNDAPRIDYSTGAKAFLLENQSTNVLPYSENFSHSSWIKNDVSIQSGYLAPDGTNNAYKVTSTGTNSHLVNTTTGGNTGAKSIYAKTTSGTGTIILFNNVNTYFTITEEWQRFEIEQDGLDFFYAADFRNDSTLTEIIIWGAQSEASSYATSYIPTSGAAATRNQELCNNATPVINSEEGTLYAEISALADDGTYRFISASSGAYTNSVRIGYFTTSNVIEFRVVSGGVNQGSLLYTLPDSTETIKVAGKYKQNDFALWVNGVEVLTDTNGSVPIGLSELSFDDGNSSNNSPFFGNTKGLKYYPKALADVQLEDLTTI